MMGRLRPARFVVFDMDGVLLDTEQFYTKATQRIVSRFGKTFDWSLKGNMIGRPAIESARRELGSLARISGEGLRFFAGEPRASEQAIVVVASDVVAVLPLTGMVDLDLERARLRRELEAAEGERTRLEGQLANEGFVARAPAHVVAGVRQKVATATEKIDVLSRRLSDLGA